MARKSFTDPLVHWSPRYTLTPKIANALMRIEAAKTIVSGTPLTPTLEAGLRNRARLQSAVEEPSQFFVIADEVIRTE